MGPREPLPGPPPLVEEVPQGEEGDDGEAMESDALTPAGAGVGFIKPTKRNIAKASAVKCMLGKGAFSKGRTSSLAVKAESLSTDELARFQEDLAALSNSRQSEDKNEVQVADISATELEPSAFLGSVFRREGTETKTPF